MVPQQPQQQRWRQRRWQHHKASCELAAGATTQKRAVSYGGGTCARLWHEPYDLRVTHTWRPARSYMDSDWEDDENMVVTPGKKQQDVEDDVECVTPASKE